MYAILDVVGTVKIYTPTVVIPPVALSLGAEEISVVRIMYPSAYYPEKGSSEGKRWKGQRLVAVENKEIEITFGIIKNLTKKIINLIQVNELLIVNMNKTNDGVIYSKNSFILRFFMETSPP